VITASVDLLSILPLLSLSRAAHSSSASTPEIAGSG
jgi:hypothetical protein